MEDYESLLTLKTQEELVALLVRARRQIHASTGSWDASSSGIPSGSGPVAMLPPSSAGCQQTSLTNDPANGISGVTIDRAVSNRPRGK
jgi:hypothetical protein